MLKAPIAAQPISASVEILSMDARCPQGDNRRLIGEEAHDGSSRDIEGAGQ
jgi:hypothetical protein